MGAKGKAFEKKLFLQFVLCFCCKLFRALCSERADLLSLPLKQLVFSNVSFHPCLSGVTDLIWFVLRVQ